MMDTRFGGSMVAMVTPFRGRSVDTTRLSLLCERQVRGGTAGIVVSGSTGEAPALSAAEQAKVLAVALEASCNRVPIIAGCGAPATEAAVGLAAAAARGRAAGLLCAPPPYSKPTQEGIFAHVRAVSLGSELPVILYDVPGRTGVAIADATVARLFEAGFIVGIKDATADLARPARLRALCGEGLRQLTGDDATAVAYRSVGGHGCISVTANVVPALCAAVQSGVGDADRLGPLHEALFVESNPIPVKAALELAGLCSGTLRLPLTPATLETVARLQAILPGLLAAEDAARLALCRAVRPRLAA